MTAMTQIVRFSEALREAARRGRAKASLRPAVFGCPYHHTVGIVTSPLPFGRCRRCGTPLTLLDAGQVLRRAG